MQKMITVTTDCGLRFELTEEQVKQALAESELNRQRRLNRGLTDAEVIARHEANVAG